MMICRTNTSVAYILYVYSNVCLVQFYDQTLSHIPHKCVVSHRYGQQYAVLKVLPHCDKRFKHLSGLRLHLDEYHPEKVQGPKLYPCHKCKKEFKYRKSLRVHFTTCNPAEKLRDLYSDKDHVDTCYNSDSIIPSQQQAEMVETFQEIIQNPIEMSELSNHTQIIRVDGSVQSQTETNTITSGNKIHIVLSTILR
jgi:ribosome-binding protein aMBF1 (putative translation factor)